MCDDVVESVTMMLCVRGVCVPACVHACVHVHVCLHVPLMSCHTCDKPMGVQIRSPVCGESSAGTHHFLVAEYLRVEAEPVW